MLIFIDSEGDPVQEFTAIYVDEKTATIVDVFHQYVRYPFYCDKDVFSRLHVHGLNRHYLSTYGLHGENELVNHFFKWLKTHPYSSIYAHAPAREVNLLSPLSVTDVHLKPWAQRTKCLSHDIALRAKLCKYPICGITCSAHADFLAWQPKHVNTLTLTDHAKLSFSHHCSLYDCIECCIFFLYGE